MTFFLTHSRSCSGREERRIAQRFVSVNTSNNSRHLASSRPLRDGTDPTRWGLVAAMGAQL